MLGQADVIARIADKVIRALKSGKKVVLFGNGGSAADAQHIAAEIVGTFNRRNRKALPAIALTTNTSNLTAIGNDFGFDNVFSRQVEGLINKGDAVIALSTSGNSANVLNGIKAARRSGAFTIGFTGSKTNKLKKLAHLCFPAPATQTPRIQECHITVGHIICELIDNAFK
ncbi:MAG: SIS domain-containing protein [Planctomycetes bacterium]|nr:SIS domain-containing protein [Planctomycetota bacterium]